MIIVHIESGLGNQMLSYCEYLAMKQANPLQELFIENIVYDIPECNETICQWNGYELGRIFGINPINIQAVLSDSQWAGIKKDIIASRFWEKKWNYPVYFTEAFNHQGLDLENIRGDFEKQSNKSWSQRGLLGKVRGYITDQSFLGNWIKRQIMQRTYQGNPALADQLFYKTDKSVFTGQRLTFKLRGSGIERIRKEIMESFNFPEFSTERNKEYAEFLDNHNSVFIHARRGDMLSANGWCYKYGYFKRAVKYIKEHVENPVFVFFTNPGSVDWCRENEKIFGMDFKKDDVQFVDWNAGEESYRDMQLMAHCKHGIITNSSFGWWGAFFIKNPGKITISPLAEINTTYHC